MIQPRTVVLQKKKLVGISLPMSLTNNRTGQLWSSFVPRLDEIKNTVNSNKFSLQIYAEDHFSNFSPSNGFIKWAALEVTDFDSIPEDMQSLELPGGLYAVFDYKGSSQDTSVFQYIFSEWLPKSDYILDDRPHFEILGEKYKNNDSDSEEEIWIPVKKK
ncbi:MAG: GyrI-like domain-containing protein [Bacteroidota bacterium]